MRWYLLQLAMLIVWREFSLTTTRENEANDDDDDDDDWDDDDDDDNDEKICPPKKLKNIPVNADKLLRGDWNIVKCLPSVFCDHMICFSHAFEKDEHMTYTLDSIAYNTSCKKNWRSEGTCKVNAKKGCVDYKGSDHRANGEYYILGTDYEHWCLLFSCLPDNNGVKRSAAWIASRDSDLVPTVISEVRNCVKKNGLNWNKFRSITGNSCEQYKEDYGE